MRSSEDLKRLFPPLGKRSSAGKSRKPAERTSHNFNTPVTHPNIKLDRIMAEAQFSKPVFPFQK